MKNRTVLLFLSYFLSMTATAGDGIGGVLVKIGDYIDKSTRSGIDSTYIIVPERPWQIALGNNINRTNYHLNAFYADDIDDAFWIKFKPQMDTGLGISAGASISYRGYGMGYQKSFSDNDNYSFTVRMCGSRYGLSFRVRGYDVSKMKTHTIVGVKDEGSSRFSQVEDENDLDLESPAKVRTLLLEGYYLFNGSRYSNTAVFDQSTQQVKSAGSLMAGFTWFKSSISYDKEEIFYLVNLMNDVGRSKQWQFAVGAGYAYNWVPLRQWMISLQAMPMVSLVNKIKSWSYDIDFPDLEEPQDDGKFTTSLIPREMETHKSHITLGGVVRGGIVYNHKRIFASITGQANTYGYTNGRNKVRMVDWYVNTALGFRF